MKANRSLFKVLSTLLILIAAITAAYGSQATRSEEFTKANGENVNFAETSVTIQESLQENTVRVSSRELEKEKFEIKQAVNSNKLKKVAVARAEKPKAKKAYYKKSAKTVKTAKVAAPAVPAKKTTPVKQVSTQKASNTKKMTREEMILLKQKQAEQILAYYISKYPILKGVKVYVRDCPNNWQGCAYYTKGIILVDPDHTAPLKKIIEHEVMHIIDWRTDNKIDYNDYHE